MDKNKFTVKSHEVCTSKSDLLIIAYRDIQELKKKALKSKLHRSRICCHKSDQSLVHEMIIALTNKVSFSPHRHVDSEESIHVIEGEVNILIFNDSGDISNSIELGESRSGRAFFYRLPRNVWHTVIVKSNIAVIQEVTSGPFEPAKTEYAPFSLP